MSEDESEDVELSHAELERIGHHLGQNAASWVDLPELGARIPPDLDYIGLGKTVTPSNRREVWALLAGANLDQATPDEVAREHGYESFTAEEWDAILEAAQEGIIEGGMKKGPK